MGIQFLGQRQQVQPVSSWHADVSQQQIEYLLCQPIKRGVAIAHPLSYIPGTLQRTHTGGEHAGLIIYHQDAFIHDR